MTCKPTSSPRGARELLYIYTANELSYGLLLHQNLKLDTSQWLQHILLYYAPPLVINPGLNFFIAFYLITLSEIKFKNLFQWESRLMDPLNQPQAASAFVVLMDTTLTWTLSSTAKQLLPETSTKTPSRDVKNVRDEDNVSLWKFCSAW